MASLDAFVDDAVYDTESVKVELNTVRSAIGDLLILFVEVIEELYLLDLKGGFLSCYSQQGRSVCELN